MAPRHIALDVISIIKENQPDLLLKSLVNTAIGLLPVLSFSHILHPRLLMAASLSLPHCLVGMFVVVNDVIGTSSIIVD